MKERAPEERQKLRLTAHLWFMMLGAPVAWLIYLQTAYLLVQYACSTNRHFVMHLASAVFLALVGFIGISSLTQWRAAGSRWPSSQDAGIESRRRTLSMMGALQSGLFMLIVIATWIGMFLLHPCQK